MDEPKPQDCSEMIVIHEQIWSQAYMGGDYHRALNLLNAGIYIFSNQDWSKRLQVEIQELPLKRSIDESIFLFLIDPNFAR